MLDWGRNKRYPARPRPEALVQRLTLTTISDTDNSPLSNVYASSIVVSGAVIGEGFWSQAKIYAVLNLHGEGHVRNYCDMALESMSIKDMKAWVWKARQPCFDVKDILNLKDAFDWRGFFPFATGISASFCTGEISRWRLQEWKELERLRTYAVHEPEVAAS